MDRNCVTEKIRVLPGNAGALLGPADRQPNRANGECLAFDETENLSVVRDDRSAASAAGLREYPTRPAHAGTLQGYMRRKTEEGLSPRTIRNHLAVLRRALNQALRWGEVQRNVASLVTPPRTSDDEVQPLTPDEARILLDALKGDRLEALYCVALALGLRQGEVLGLAWEDVDLEDGTLRVRHTLQRYGGAYHLDEPKTSKSRRTMPIAPPLVEMLRSHRTRQIEEQLRAGPVWAENPWNLIFTTEAGRPLSNAVVTHRFQAILADAGLPRQRFHDMRHAAASFMLAQDVPLRTAMEILGHSDIATTANVYSHVGSSLQRDATEKVAAMLWANS